MEAQTKTQRIVLDHNHAPLSVFEREGWVLLKIPRGDIDGVGEVK